MSVNIQGKPVRLAIVREMWGRNAGLQTAAVTALIAVLVLLAVASVSQSISAVRQTSEVEYGEAIIHDQAARLLRGEPLYQPLASSPYTVTAYTPIYYLLAAVLQKTFGAGFAPGRALSLLAASVATALIGWLAGARMGNRWCGALAAAMFLALGLPRLPGVMPPWSGLYKEDVLGVALALGAIASLTGNPTRRRLICGGLLAGLAVLTKQTLIASGLAGSIWLWQHDRRGAVIYAGAAFALTLGVAITLQTTSGGAFLANIVLANVNPFRLSTLSTNLIVLVAFQLGPLLAAAVEAGHRDPGNRPPHRDLLTLYWAATWVPLVGLGKVGANHNHWMELAAATSIMAAAGIWRSLNASRLGSGMLRRLAPTMLIGTTPMLWMLLGASMPAVAEAARPLDPSPVTEVRQADIDFRGLIDLVRSEPGEVLAEPLDVLTLAGRPVLLEPYIFSILQQQHAWDARPLVRRICDGRVTLLVLGYPLEQHTVRSRDGYTFWPEPVVSALRARMTLRAVYAGRYLYAPSAARPPDGLAVADRAGACG